MQFCRNLRDTKTIHLLSSMTKEGLPELCHVLEGYRTPQVSALCAKRPVRVKRELRTKLIKAQVT